MQRALGNLFIKHSSVFNFILLQVPSLHQHGDTLPPLSAAHTANYKQECGILWNHSPGVPSLTFQRFRSSVQITRPQVHSLSFQPSSAQVPYLPGNNTPVCIMCSENICTYHSCKYVDIRSWCSDIHLRAVSNEATGGINPVLWTFWIFLRLSEIRFGGLAAFIFFVKTWNYHL